MAGLKYTDITLSKILESVSSDTVINDVYVFWKELESKMSAVASAKSNVGSYCFDATEALERGDKEARDHLESIRDEANALQEKVTDFVNAYIQSTFVPVCPVPPVDHVFIEKGKAVAVIPEDWEYFEERHPAVFIALADACIPDSEKATSTTVLQYLEESIFFQKLELAALFNPDDYYHNALDSLRSDYEDSIVRVNTDKE